MPRRLGTVGSVRARQMANSDSWAQVLHTFWPVRIHWSPSGSARMASDARSEPAPGSLNIWHHRSWLATMGGQEAQALLLGAVGEQSRGRVVQPEGVEAAQVERSEDGLCRAGFGGREVESAVFDGPGGHGQAGGGEGGVPGLVVGSGPDLADGLAAVGGGVAPGLGDVVGDPLGDGGLDFLVGAGGGDGQPLGGHWAGIWSNRWTSASSASAAVIAPPGGVGNFTGPCSRLGNRIVAWPGQVISPRWFSP